MAMLLQGAEVLPCPLLSLPLCCEVIQIQIQPGLSPNCVLPPSSFPTQLMLRLQIF